jgi:hypothetical protein
MKLSHVKGIVSLQPLVVSMLEHLLLSTIENILIDFETLTYFPQHFDHDS